MGRARGPVTAQAAPHRPGGGTGHTTRADAQGGRSRNAARRTGGGASARAPAGAAETRPITRAQSTMQAK
jgi:hypothetical protein